MTTISAANAVATTIRAPFRQGYHVLRSTNPAMEWLARACHQVPPKKMRTRPLPLRPYGLATTRSSNPSPVRSPASVVVDAVAGIDSPRLDRGIRIVAVGRVLGPRRGVARREQLVRAEAVRILVAMPLERVDRAL